MEAHPQAILIPLRLCERKEEARQYACVFFAPLVRSLASSTFHVIALRTMTHHPLARA